MTVVTLNKMKRVCKRKVQIDALTVCFQVVNDYHYNNIIALDYGEVYELEDFNLVRITGRYYNNIYSILYYNGEEEQEFGVLKFNLGGGENTHTNGNHKAWISLNNVILYSKDISYLGYITQMLGLDYHNITTLDLCLDTPFQVSTTLKKHIRNKGLLTILNGKGVRDRAEDRPEITYITSGDLDRDKYLTVTVKQRKAIHDKNKGVTITTYNKVAEIKNSSNKQYILDYYANPRNLFRTEVHLNHADIKDYLNTKDADINVFMFDEALLEDMFFYHLNNVIYFKKGRKDYITWEELLGRCA